MRSPLPAVPASTTAAATPETPAAFLRPGLADRQLASPQFRVVQGVDGPLSLFSGAHFHEAESTGPAGELVGDDPGRNHGAVRGEQRPGADPPLSNTADPPTYSFSFMLSSVVLLDLETGTAKGAEQTWRITTLRSALVLHCLRQSETGLPALSIILLARVAGVNQRFPEWHRLLAPFDFAPLALRYAQDERRRAPQDERR